MIEVMESRGNLLWLRARGKLSRRDYQEVLIPRLEAVIREHGKAWWARPAGRTRG